MTFIDRNERIAAGITPAAIRFFIKDSVPVLQKGTGR